MKYCNAVFQTKRWKTREVLVGNVGVGGENPVRIQSMTTSDTRNVDATVDQIMRLADEGCEIARVTVQGKKEAEACEFIKGNLIKKGYDIPVVADIHFYPPAAMLVAEFVDKVRVNPGNFVDKRASFKVLEYDDVTYAAELEKIDEKFSPLVLKCKELQRSMRIGTNHGSLSDRIMNRYGDTPAGMVESALEFARVCRKHNYHDFMFSMKASNPQVMIQAYRLLVAAMMDLGWDYPLHLGVTEAGEGEDGRVKSAMGIGALLLDGLGDTIRVSLTEDPWHEIDPCKRLVKLAERYQGVGVHDFVETHRRIDQVNKRAVQYCKKTPLHRDGSVYVVAGAEDVLGTAFYKELGCGLGPKPTLCSADAVIFLDRAEDPNIQQKLQTLVKNGIGVITPAPIPGATRLIPLAEVDKVRFQNGLSQEPMAVLVADEDPEQWGKLVSTQAGVILFRPGDAPVHRTRRFFEWLHTAKLEIPVVLWLTYEAQGDDLVMAFGSEAGALLCDGLGEGVCLEAPVPLETARGLGFHVLQGARMRSFKTEFISCPSCGRTLFDLQEVSARIRARTDHLPGVKIAIMGCIVNGPGEMADADFGYVGSRPGKVDLYVKKECVERYVDFSQADGRLIELIKAHGRWVEPEVVEAQSVTC